MRFILAPLLIALSSPAIAQMDMSMPGMTAMAPDAGPASATEEIGSTPAPAPPRDHAADALFDPAAMTQAREDLRRESGAWTGSMVLFNLAEYRVQKGANAYRWDGEGWFGGDINRFVVKSEGEGRVGNGIESAELQALYSRAIDPYFNVQGGIRHDLRPGTPRTYATVGIEGFAPYWFEVSAALFLSDKGDVLGRAEGYYDQRITQKMILQPLVELNFAAQDVIASRIGAGLTDVEVGLRLRYELKREFAPYIGISYESKIGRTARLARAMGDDVFAKSLVFGARFGF
jgi:copper resistance protein B